MPIIKKYFIIKLNCKILNKLIKKMRKKNINYFNLQIIFMKFCICVKLNNNNNNYNDKKRLNICGETSICFYYNKKQENIKYKIFNNNNNKKLSLNNNTTKSLVCFQFFFFDFDFFF